MRKLVRWGLPIAVVAAAVALGWWISRPPGVVWTTQTPEEDATRTVRLEPGEPKLDGWWVYADLERDPPFWHVHRMRPSGALRRFLLDRGLVRGGDGWECFGEYDPTGRTALRDGVVHLELARRR